MKLKPVAFFLAMQSGLELTQGHEFEARGRRYVVHKAHEPFCIWDKTYKVSDFETGFAVPIMPTRVRHIAVACAIEVLMAYTDRQIFDFARSAAAHKARFFQGLKATT
jgi:hypothetical protein